VSTDGIRIWNRQAGHEEFEKVYGGSLVNWLYGTSLGRTASGGLTGTLPSRAYGAYQSSSLSRHKIRPFIREFGIKMDEYEPGPFGSFNDFFSRHFKPGSRRFVPESDRMPAFSEARYLAWESVKKDEVFPVKGEFLSAEALLSGSGTQAQGFTGGPCLIARLCPTDYHRFHYPDDGRTLESWRVPGRLHSVNPAALKFRGDIFATNERHVSILETKNLGKLAYIEVGALCVGLIRQTHPEDAPFKRGDEKGTFLFGASTVILLGERGAWVPDPDLLEQTSKHHRETLIRLGQGIARAASNN
jgi:phosphatidylserine decarboxylase